MPNDSAAGFRHKRSIPVEIAKFAIAVFLIVTPFRWYVAQPFLVSGASMAPTIDANEYIVVDKISYRFKSPERGDVVVFRYPLDASIYFIKRVIGLPGETIVVHDGTVAVHGANGSTLTLEEPYVTGIENMKKESSTTTLAADEYFLLGDNRDASSDSRRWGPLPFKYIVGRAFMSLYPLEDLSLYPGDYSL